MSNRSYINNHKGHPHFISDSKISSLKNKLIFSDEEDRLLRVIRDLSDPTKLRIFLLLQKVEEIPVSDLTLILDISQSAVSHALSDLKNLGLVESHRCGQLICYSLKKKNNKKFLSFFEKFA